jgi:uncharacterized protein (DUF433 family)
LQELLPAKKRRQSGSAKGKISRRNIMNLDRITLNPEIMGGKPCIRGMRVTVGTIVGLVASGYTIETILEAYPYLEKEDIFAALSYAAWRSEEYEVNLISV